MNTRFMTVVFALTGAVWLSGAFLSGCTNPELPTDPVDTDQPDDPGPPEDPGPVPDEPSDPDPDPPVTSETTIIIDFDAAVPGIAGEAFAGTGFASSPEPGQLDGDAWRISGFSDGDLDFGGTADTGDLARGVSAGRVSTGGLYAFTVGAEDVALGVQPTSTDFAPGSIVLRLPAVASTMQECRIEYELWMLNDQDRSTVWSAWYSTDDATWTELAGTECASPGPADIDPQWIPTSCTATIPLADAGLGTGDPVYLRWDATDGEGDGSRDESAIDDIMVTFVFEE